MKQKEKVKSALAFYAVMCIGYGLCREVVTAGKHHACGITATPPPSVGGGDVGTGVGWLAHARSRRLTRGFCERETCSVSIFFGKFEWKNVFKCARGRYS